MIQLRESLSQYEQVAPEAGEETGNNKAEGESPKQPTSNRN